MVINIRGGISLPSFRDKTINSPIVSVSAPEELIIPLPDGAKPCVAVGEHVLRGQRVAEAADESLAPVHAGASGTVAALARWAHPGGSERVCVAIECDREQAEAAYTPLEDWENASPETLLAALREAGVAEQGMLRGAKHVDYVIVNGVEITPYESSATRMLLEESSGIIEGIAVLTRIFPQAQPVLAIAQDRSDVMAAMREPVRTVEKLHLETLAAKYPQGNDAMLVQSITGRKVPREMSPAELGCVVIGVKAAADIARAVRGIPVTDCVLTAAGGALLSPQNLRVPVGTSLRAIAAACGGFAKEPEKIVVGGSMQGIAQPSMNVPVDKDTDAVLFLAPGEEGSDRVNACIHCGRCTEVCPMGLLPCYLYEFARLDIMEECRRLRIAECIGCGACTAACPSGIALSAEIQAADEKNGVQETDDEDVLRIFQRSGRLLPWINRNDTP